MIRAVFDCNVVMAGLGWRNEPYLCLVQVARRRVRAFVTNWLVEEYQRVAKRMEAEKLFQQSIWPTLDWFLSTARRVVPAPLGRQRSRDASDDPYLACALAAQAGFIVSRDPDLLTLGKPFGVEIVTPRELLSRLAAGL
jgi:putative PIN family toxin of toxin-antitoxin system